MTRFEKIDPFATRLGLETLCWKLPQSHIYLPVLRFTGNGLSASDVWIVQHRYALSGSFLYKGLLVLDLRALVADAESVKRLAGRFREHTPYVLLLTGSALESDDPSVFIHTRLSDALIQATGLLKKHRFDGGKNLDLASLSVNETLYLVEPEAAGVDIRFEKNDQGWLQVKISGHYPQGSEGSPEGNRIRCALEYGFEIVSPRCLIVDMRELHYEWGDDLAIAPFPVLVNREFPYRLVLSEQNEKAIRSLHKSETRIAYSLTQAYEELGIGTH